MVRLPTTMIVTFLTAILTNNGYAHRANNKHFDTIDSDIASDSLITNNIDNDINVKNDNNMNSNIGNNCVCAVPSV